MRIVAIHDIVSPIRSNIANAYIDFSQMTASVVAVVPDVNRICIGESGDAGALAMSAACVACRKCNACTRPTATGISSPSCRRPASRPSTACCARYG